MQGPLARAVFEQGDIGDGGIGRDQFAEVLVRSLMSDAAIGWTFELFAGPGRSPTDCDDLFEALTPDAADALDGPRPSVCRRSTTSPRAFARTRSHQETAVMSAAIPTPGVWSNDDTTAAAIVVDCTLPAQDSHPRTVQAASAFDESGRLSRY
jgi:hypothetical protein